MSVQLRMLPLAALIATAACFLPGAATQDVAVAAPAASGELVALIDEYSSDARSVSRFYDISVSDTRLDRQDALATEWIERLVHSPSDELRLATRAHHIRRWTIPRSDYPDGRAGYYRWRRALQQLHADEVSEILETEGYAEVTRSRVRALVRKEGLGRGGDPEVQSFEDALCLVFLETQLASTAAKLGDSERTVDVLRKTARKMSPLALELAAALPLSDAERSLLKRALG